MSNKTLAKGFDFGPATKSQGTVADLDGGASTGSVAIAGRGDEERLRCNRNIQKTGQTCGETAGRGIRREKYITNKI